MKALWRALIARITAWLEPSLPLLPGDCECSHARCAHRGGTGRCGAQWPPDENNGIWTNCACQIYIRDDDDDDDGEPETPSPEELETMYQR